MNITVCNFTSVSDVDVEEVCAAVSRQIDNAQWKIDATIRLGGDAIIYFWERIADVPMALADESPRDGGLPFGLVILELSEQLQESWATTLSREVRALIGDVIGGRR